MGGAMRAFFSIRHWRQTAALLIIAVLGGSVIMVMLGNFLVRQDNDLQTQASADAGVLYVEGFLAPFAHKYLRTGALSDDDRRELQSILARAPVSAHFVALKMWNLDGSIIYSSAGNTDDTDTDTDELGMVLAGQIVVELYEDETEGEVGPIDYPFLEIHAPIYDPVTAEIVAVGEIYQDAEPFLNHRAANDRTIWRAIGGSAFGMTALIVLIAIQRVALLRHLESLRNYSEQNEALKTTADAARLHASRINEQLLNKIGADLHDGPIQMLSLLMLMGGRDRTDEGKGARHPDKGAPSAMSAHEVATAIMSDLRSISSGLILPELRDLTLDATLRLAVARHQAVTGEMVEMDFGPLPDRIDGALKICCYRIVQEGLNNSARHAAGARQRASARVEDGRLILTVSDDGKQPISVDIKHRSGDGLGLQGLRNRLDVFGGTLEIRHRPGFGTDLVATVPLG